MESEKLASARRWRNAIVLFLGIFVACALTALLLLRVVPSTVEWGGISLPIALATLGALAGVAACLCAIIVVEKRRS
jgi:hypothetical protein